MANDILIVDDETDIRNVVSDLLKDEGYQTRAAANGPEALELIQSRRPNLVILDIWLGDTRFDGIKVLEILRRDHPMVPVVMMSGHGNIETAVAAIKRGAYDFIEKPFKGDRLLLIVKRAIETARLRQENNEMKERFSERQELIGVSNYVNQLAHTIEKVAPTNSRIFITGPSGSGKEVAARLLHAQSTRATAPFVVASCATVNADDIEATLFGVEATSIDREGYNVGLLEQAHLGTLFLDEVVDLPLSTQGKLARMLHEGHFTRVGGERKIEVDVRVIASTAKDVQEAIASGRFREDLYYRLNVVPILVKPLRDRREDIPLFAELFLQYAYRANGQTARRLGPDALDALKAYDWPGNIRQLRNVMDWLVIMASGDQNTPMTAEMLPPEVISALPIAPQIEGSQEIMRLPLREAREVFERQYLLSQVSRFSGNISQTASFIGMERSALHRKLRSLGIDRNVA
jgi:two-component system nitrogen regulation response regulator NtrX